MISIAVAAQRLQAVVDVLPFYVERQSSVISATACDFVHRLGEKLYKQLKTKQFAKLSIIAMSLMPEEVQQ